MRRAVPIQEAMRCLPLALALALLLAVSAVARAEPTAPALDPPALEGSVEPAPRPLAAAWGDGQVEWVLHKSGDGAHPNGNEQSLVWLMNRARQDPSAEGFFLATVDDPGVQSAIRWFDVDLDVLQDEFDAIAPKPPAAFDARLFEAAFEHSLYLIANDAQNHTGQFDRVEDAGFRFNAMRGNVFSYADSALYGHAGFNVDWGGSDGTGMQSGRGHRRAIMSIDGDYTNVGLAAVPEASPSTQVGPLVVTGNYASASTSQADHYNRFLVGTVWEDANGNDRYDAGEGFAGVVVQPDAGSYFAVTAAGGGYAIPIGAGAYAVRFSGGGVPERTHAVAVGATSALLDYEVPEPAAGASSASALLALVALQRSRARS
jgi:hypothetical protein